MPVENYEYVNRRNFKREIVVMITKLEILLEEVDEAEEYEVDGKIPVYLQPSWRDMYGLSDKLGRIFKKSWTKIKSNYDANGNAEAKGNA